MKNLLFMRVKFILFILLPFCFLCCNNSESNKTSKKELYVKKIEIVCLIDSMCFALDEIDSLVCLYESNGNIFSEYRHNYDTLRNKVKLLKEMFYEYDSIYNQYSVELLKIGYTSGHSGSLKSSH